MPPADHPLWRDPRDSGSRGDVGTEIAPHTVADAASLRELAAFAGAALDALAHAARAARDRQPG